MDDATEKMQPQKRGRPATGKGTPIQVRIQPDMLEWLDRERKKATPEKTRPEMVRWLLGVVQGTMETGPKKRPAQKQPK